MEDESALRAIAPYIAAALDNCTRYSQNGRENSQNAPVRGVLQTQFATHFKEPLIIEMGKGIIGRL
jgi:hypothetical protein